jgi:hypothetical protein
VGGNPYPNSWGVLMKKILYALVIILVAFCSFTPVMANYQAAVKNSDTVLASSCYALDVIFIVDQSESMSDQFSPTDPSVQRQSAVQAMIDWLAENSLDICPGTRHQVGVISFGSTVEENLPLTEISPSTFQEMRMLEEDLNKNIVAENLGATSPLGAFEKAKQMFSGVDIKDGAPRKQVIVFLTDGQINDGSGNEGIGSLGKTKELADWVNSNFLFDPALLKRERCLNELVESFGGYDKIPYEKQNECLQQFDVKAAAYQNSTYLYMVLMNYGQSWSPDIRKIYQDMASVHGGDVMDFFEKGEDNRNGIPSYFQTVLSRLAGIPSGEVDCNPIAVNPYLDKATFVFYKFAADTNVKLSYTDVDGIEHTISDGKSDNGGFDLEKDDGYEKYGTNERYIFNHPYPGIWSIKSDRCTNGGVSAFYQEVKINPGGYSLPFTKIPQYDIAPYYDESDPTYLTYQMHDSAGNVILNSDQDIFSVNVISTVTDKNGKEYPYTLVWDKTDNLFRATEPLQVPIAGIYKVSFKGTTMMHDPNVLNASTGLSETFKNSTELFNHEGLEFNVGAVTPFVTSLETPKAGEVLNQIHGTILEGWPLPVKPILIKAQVAWRDKPLDVPITQLLADPNQSFVAWVELPDGTSSKKVTLQLAPKSTDTFVGEISGIESVSPLKLHVELNGQVSEGYRPDHRVMEVDFSRRDFLPIYKPSFYILLIWLIIFGLLILTVYEIWDHYDPVDGQLAIYQNNVKVGTLFLWSGKRITYFKKKTLDGYDLAKLCVRYKKYEKTDEYEGENDKVRDIVVTGVTECRSKFSFDLASNDSYSYCATHTEFEMKYENQNGPSRTPYLRPGIYFMLPVIAILLVVFFFLMK